MTWMKRQSIHRPLTSPEKLEMFYSDKERVILCLDRETMVTTFIFLFIKKKKNDMKPDNQ